MFSRFLRFRFRFVVPLLLVLATFARAQDQAAAASSDIDPEMARDAGNKAITTLITDLTAEKNLPKRFAILPMQHDIDSDYFTGQLRNQFSNIGGQNGFELYTRMDDDWKALLDEIKWGQKFEDTMDPATVQKFGRIQGVQGIIIGRLVSISKDDKGTVHARISAQAFEVETGRQLWGEEKVGEVAVPPPPAPPINWVLIGGCVAGAVLLVVIIIFSMGAAKKASRPR